MPAIQRYQWLPNFLTALRVILAVPVFVLAAQDQWVLAFWLFILALVTDFLDGLAAKKLNAYTTLGEYLDPVADTVLAAAGVGAMLVSHDLPLWAGIALAVPAVIVGFIKFGLRKDHRIRVVQPLFSAPYLFAVWLAVAWYYVAQAYGWSWWYVALALGVALAAALLKRHRLRLWFAFLLTRQQ